MSDFTRELTMLEDPRPKCSVCLKPRDRPGQRYCRACHAAWQRQNRPGWSGLSEATRRKQNTRAYTRMLISRGKLLVRPCWCGEAAQAHHPDYDRPRLVIWLCREHYLALHVWMDEQRPR